MRIQSIDVTRGIAILGILLMNIYYLGDINFGYVDFANSLLSDQIIYLINGLFFDGRFRTLLSIVLGAGMAIQYVYCQKHQINYQSFIKSRFNWLLMLGLIHCAFVFAGDILFSYAICALVVRRKLELPLKTLLRLSKNYLIVGVIVGLVFGVISDVMLYDESVNMYRESAAFQEYYTSWYGDYWLQFFTQASYLVFVLILMPIVLYWQTAGLMLLGVFLYRTRFFTQGFKSGYLPKFLIAGLALSGSDLAVRYYFFQQAASVSMELASTSAIFISLIYVHWIIKWVNASHSRLVNWLAAAGKLALTLYLAQSVIIGTLLRWVIPEFNLTATRLDYLAIALGCIVMQLMFASLYFRWLKLGPVEALWRQAYRKPKASHENHQSELVSRQG